MCDFQIKDAHPNKKELWINDQMKEDKLKMDQ
jgi:hypothetical protein